MLELRFARKPPETAELPRMVFLRQVQQRLLEKLGPEAEMRIDDGLTFLWIQRMRPTSGVGRHRLAGVPPLSGDAHHLGECECPCCWCWRLQASRTKPVAPARTPGGGSGEIAKGAFPSDAKAPACNGEIRRAGKPCSTGVKWLSCRLRARTAAGGRSHDLRHCRWRLRLLHEIIHW
ncbi:MAG: hypothetical protein H7A20_01955 [Rhodanobacteraceae bacterium]|nr:hypothetical protein [Rhodanobacteraceae bacterium]